jgi:hypothetical protein
MAKNLYDLKMSVVIGTTTFTANHLQTNIKEL